MQFFSVQSVAEQATKMHIFEIIQKQVFPIRERNNGGRKISHKKAISLKQSMTKVQEKGSFVMFFSAIRFPVGVIEV